jgi:hypothetical protein
MNRNRIMMFVAIALLPIAAAAATFVVPVVGTGGGANGSQWQSELTLHSNSAASIAVALTFHDRNGAAETASVTLAPRSTVSIQDIVKSRFGRVAATGAVEIEVDDLYAKKLAVASRTFNSSQAGDFGQDIPAVNLKDAAVAGDTIVLTAPARVIDYRFNAGVYAAADSTVRWELVRADGTLAKSVTMDYAAGTQLQYNFAVESIFGETPAANDALLAFVTNGRVILYGSAINNLTGDPTYVPGIATAVDIRFKFAGIDTDLDGNVEIADSNDDGVLDAPLIINSTAGWPSSFRLLVNASNPKFELVDQSSEVYITQDGYCVWMPNGESTIESIKIRVTVDGVPAVFTIPVKFV